MHTIAVILGDNDFENTFQPLLESVYRAMLWKGDLSKETVEKAIRCGVEFHYVAFQLGDRYAEVGYRKVEETVRHLSDIMVLFDEKAEADIQRNDHDGGAWYLEMATGKVYAY
jgi:hypothetical protein